MSNKISETSTARPFNAANLNTPVTSVYLDAGLYRRFYAAVQAAAALVATKVARVKLVQATDAAGAGVKDLVAAVGSTTGFAEVDGLTEMLDTANGYRYVAAVIDTDNGTAVVGSGILFADGQRHNF